MFPSDAKAIHEHLAAEDKQLEFVDGDHYLQEPPSARDEVADIVMNMLAKNPADRYLSAGEMSRALEENMYGGGYGPTVVKLAAYVDELGPQLLSSPTVVGS